MNRLSESNSSKHQNRPSLKSSCNGEIDIDDFQTARYDSDNEEDVKNHLQTQPILIEHRPTASFTPSNVMMRSSQSERSRYSEEAEAFEPQPQGVSQMSKIGGKMILVIRKLNGNRNIAPRMSARTQRSMHMSQSSDGIHQSTDQKGTPKTELLYVQEQAADLTWFNITQEHKRALGQNWLCFFLILQVIAFFLAMVPMWFAPLFILTEKDTNQRVILSGLTYRINEYDSIYCFNIRFLNFKRVNCNILDLSGGDAIEEFFQKKVRFASFFLLTIYGFGSFLNLIGCFVSFWMIKGYMFGLGNAIIALSSIFYILGIAQFEGFMMSAGSQIDLEFRYWQIMTFIAIVIQICCYFMGQHWSNEIEKINKIKSLMDGADDEDQENSALVNSFEQEERPLSMMVSEDGAQQ